MTDVIKDGHGSGNRAKVDDHGRLWVSANMIDHRQHHALYHKNLYIMQFDITLGSTSEVPLAFFKNIDSTKDFEVYVADISTDAVIELNWRFDDERSSGGTEITAINTNRGTGSVLSSNEVEIYEGGAADDLVLDGTNGIVFHHTWMGVNESHHMDFNGSLIMPAQTSMSLTVIGTAGDKVSLTAMMAYHDAGTVL